MDLSKTEQKRMLKDFVGAFIHEHIREYFDGWTLVESFDRHSPFENAMLVTPNHSEIKVFMPNSTKKNIYMERENTINVWFDIYGEGKEEMLEFDRIGELIDYLIEQYESENL